MIPVALGWKAVTGFIASNKWILLVALYLGSMYAAWNEGGKYELRKLNREATTAATVAVQEGIKKVAKAGEDTAKIVRLENENERLREAFDQIGDRVACPLTDDELRFLEGIREATER